MRLRRALDAAARPLLRAIHLHDSIHRHYPPNERPREYGYALKSLDLYMHHKGAASILDVGPGRSSWPHLLWYCGYHVEAVDQEVGYWKRREFNRHYPVTTHDITESPMPYRFDAITCISTLEHIRKRETALKNMALSLRPNGILIVTLPVHISGNGMGYENIPYMLCPVRQREQMERIPDTVLVDYQTTRARMRRPGWLLGCYTIRRQGQIACKLEGPVPN